MSDPAARPATRAYTWYVVGTLLSIYMVHHLDRMVITLLLEPIRHEFDLSDGQLGLLAGVAYAVPFAIAGIPLGMLIDRIHRVRLLALLLSIWSGLTALCALAGNFWALLLARIGVGAAESGGTPANMAIISDYVPANRRSGAFGVYYMGPHLGTIIGFAVAGAVAAAYGWRMAFLIVGLPGLALALVLFVTVREPPRGERSVDGAGSKTTAPPLGQVLRTIGHLPAVVHLIVGCTLANVVAAGLSSWLPAFMIRLHGAELQSVGYAIAFGIAPFAAAGSLIGGFAADRIGSQSTANVARMLAIATALTIPAVCFGLTTDQFALLVAAFAVQHIAHASLIAPSYAGVLGLVPASMRGVAAAIMQVASNVLGFGVGVQVVGLVSQALAASSGTNSLRYAMIGFALLNLWTAAHFIAAARHLKSAQGRAATAPAIG